MTILSDQSYEKILLPDENATIELGRKIAPTAQFAGIAKTLR
jgi:hypothetical protein